MSALLKFSVVFCTYQGQSSAGFILFRYRISSLDEPDLWHIEIVLRKAGELALCGDDEAVSTPGTFAG